MYWNLCVIATLILMLTLCYVNLTLPSWRLRHVWKSSGCGWDSNLETMNTKHATLRSRHSRFPSIWENATSGGPRDTSLYEIVNSRFIERLQKRSCRNQLIDRRLTKTKLIGSGQDPESQAGRLSDGYGYIGQIKWKCSMTSASHLRFLFFL